jgi:hypothetical protein
MKCIKGLKNGSGSWLDFVGAAIREADLPREERHLLYGAFCMACAFLADIEGGDGRLGAVSADPAHDRIAAAIRATTTLVTGPPNLIGFDLKYFRPSTRGPHGARFPRSNPRAWDYPTFSGFTTGRA